MRRAARTDGNHSEILAALRKAGAGVCDLSRVGQGCPDALVSYHGQWYLVEIKDRAQPPSRRKLRPTQRDWHAQHSAKVHVITSAEEALRAIGAMATDWRKALGDV